VRRALLLLALAFPACASRPGTAPGAHAGDPATPDEKAVAEHILKGAHDPASVEWVVWGPHDLTGETHFKDPSREHLIRVRYRIRQRNMPVMTEDRIFPLDPLKGTVGPSAMNAEGSDWLTESRRAKAQKEQEGREGYGRQ
jgi:hypothetical protein